jgi:acetylornithine deacetylase/succinyl-diaminopimelate desuccinylase-like protein
MTDPVLLLQQLIRYDTTNPPGNEHDAVRHIESVLREAGIETQLLAHDSTRPNLIGRITGTGQAPPLLMHAHIDVVPTANQPWTRDPFGGEIIDGYIWGRGALDMKGGAVMMVDAMVKLAASQEKPAGDIILAIVADEESGGTLGARFLVEQHPEVFAGVRYAIGEFGAFPITLAGVRFYPIQIAERVSVKFDLTMRGEGGHGSLPIHGGAMARLGRTLRRLDRRRLPVHIVDANRMMLEAMIDHTSGAPQRALRSLLNERTAGATLTAFRSQLGVLEPVMRNTVSPTIVQGGTKDNVIPAEVRLQLDGRMLPGLAAEAFAEEVQHLVGREVEVSHTSESISALPEPDMGLFDLLAAIVKERDPQGVPVPFLLPAVTDGRWFNQLGIQHYGFLPMSLPDDFAFQKTVHAADERIPVTALQRGCESIFDLLRRYRG